MSKYNLTVTIATYVCADLFGNGGHTRTVDVNPEWIAPGRCNTHDCPMYPMNVRRIGKTYWEKLVTTQKMEKVQL